MNRFQRWWTNADYDRNHMRRFYETHPDWSDLPPEAVANSLTFQSFALGEAGRHAWTELKTALSKDWETIRLWAQQTGRLK